MGMTISQAIQYMRLNTAQQSNAIPPSMFAMDRAHEAAFRGKPPESKDRIDDARRQLVEALSRLNGQAAEYIFASFTWADIDSVLGEVLLGALSDIGDRPDLLPPQSPALHFAQAFVRRKLFSLYNSSSPNEGRGPVLSASVDGEPQDLGNLLAAFFLSRAGFRVIFLGPSLPFDALTSAIRTSRPIAVCLAAMSESAAATLKSWSKQLRALKDESDFDYGALPICFTGRIFAEKPELRKQIHGHFIGIFGQDAVEVVESIAGGGNDSDRRLDA